MFGVLTVRGLALLAQQRKLGWPILARRVALTPEIFSQLIARVTGKIAGRKLDAELAAFLEAEFPASGKDFQAIFDACQQAIAAGWMCKYEGGGIRYGRVIKPTPAHHAFSVDVVDMENVKGPHHRHPLGEIDMIMPLSGDPKFDGHGRGWLVYPADSAHPPTVIGGRALVLYLLPEGAIEFSKS